MKKYQINAQERKELGRKVKKLRKQGILPANVFGKKIKSISLAVDKKEFLKIYDQAGETSIVEVMIGKDLKNTLIHNIQFDPVSGEPLHIDFLQVDLKQKVKSMVPIILTGESPAEKQSIGTVVQFIDEIEIEALPTEIPDNFEIDISVLVNIDDQIKVGDMDAGKTSIIEDKEKIILKVEEIKKEEEPVPAAEVPSEELPSEPQDGQTLPEDGKKPEETE